MLTVVALILRVLVGSTTIILQPSYTPKCPNARSQYGQQGKSRRKAIRCFYHTFSLGVMHDALRGASEHQPYGDIRGAGCAYGGSLCLLVFPLKSLRGSETAAGIRTKEAPFQKPSSHRFQVCTDVACAFQSSPISTSEGV